MTSFLGDGRFVDGLFGEAGSWNLFGHSGLVGFEVEADFGFKADVPLIVKEVDLVFFVGGGKVKFLKAE